MSEKVMLKVKNTMVLTYEETMAVESNEALFLFHSWLRSELQLVEIAHDILIAHADEGKNSNYSETDLYREVENLLGSESLTIGQLEWIHETIQDLSDMVTEVFGVDGYTCCYHEGDWGMFPSNWDW